MSDGIHLVIFVHTKMFIKSQKVLSAQLRFFKTCRPLKFCRPRQIPIVCLLLNVLWAKAVDLGAFRHSDFIKHASILKAA